MTTLSAALANPFQNNNVASNKKTKKTQSRFSKITKAVGNYLINVSEAIYEARMEEVKRRIYYHI